ncbi:hypothetical protein Tco_1006947 [Tanacetum coccineum]|uniref:Uncharacterized protein n=1 Tax=Tanacetum coccineum TaxID=301880 RepID=A0ABQ5FK06_9ASTR
MSLLCSNSSSQSPKNFHTFIESLPSSTTLVENSDSNREEIDIFSGPDDSIPPGIESNFESEEDIIDNLLNNDSTHERLTFNIEPDAPVINNVDELNEDECFDPGGSEINVEVDSSFTFVTWIFLPYVTYPENRVKFDADQAVELYLSLTFRLSVRENSRRTKNDRVKYEWDAKQGLVGNLKSSCTDIAKISRKRSKPDNHGHGNGIECAKAGRMLSKVNKSQLMVNTGQPQKDKTQNSQISPSKKTKLQK